MAELVGDAADYFDPYNPESLAVLLLKYLGDEKLISEMGSRALQRSGRFSWQESARKTWEVLYGLAENG